MAQQVDQKVLFSPETGPIISAVKPYIGGEDKPPRLMGWLMPDHDGRLLAVPDNVVGFSLKILVPKAGGIIACQRDYAQNVYVSLAKSPEEAPEPDLEWVQPRYWIEVLENKNWGLYTAWQADRENPLTTNNVGLWEIDEKIPGHVTFWKVGIVSPNGRDFYVIHEKSWDGRLYSIEAAQVGYPSDPRFGPFESRAAILKYKPFIEALPTLPSRDATDLEQPLAFPEDPSIIVVDWYNPFMGMGRGQGIVVLADGSSAWLRGQDIEGIEGLDLDKPVHLARGTRLGVVPRPNGKVVVNDMGKTPRIVGARLIAQA